MRPIKTDPPRIMSRKLLLVIMALARVLTKWGPFFDMHLTKYLEKIVDLYKLNNVATQPYDNEDVITQLYKKGYLHADERDVAEMDALVKKLPLNSLPKEARERFSGEPEKLALNVELDILLAKERKYFWEETKDIRLIDLPAGKTAFTPDELVYLATKLSRNHESYMIRGRPSEDTLKRINELVQWGYVFQESGDLIMGTERRETWDALRTACKSGTESRETWDALRTACKSGTEYH